MEHLVQNNSFPYAIIVPTYIDEASRDVPAGYLH